MQKNESPSGQSFSSVPKDNLDWMFGSQEVKSVPEEVAQTFINTNKELVKKLRELDDEQTTLNKQIEYHERRIGDIDKKIQIVSQKSKIIKKKHCDNTRNDLLQKVFSPAQIEILLGKRKVVWSHDDMAMAFTLRQMGNKEFYLYLKDTLNIPLPALSAVQKWSASHCI